MTITSLYTLLSFYLVVSLLLLMFTYCDDYILEMKGISLIKRLIFSLFWFPVLAVTTLDSVVEKFIDRKSS